MCVRIIRVCCAYAHVYILFLFSCYFFHFNRISVRKPVIYHETPVYIVSPQHYLHGRIRVLYVLIPQPPGVPYRYHKSIDSNEEEEEKKKYEIKLYYYYYYYYEREINMTLWHPLKLVIPTIYYEIYRYIL